MNLLDAIIPEHAAVQMDRRQVAEAEVRQVPGEPQQVLEVRPGRVVAQRMIGRYLLRVFVDVDRSPPEVVTVYRTSQLKKYRGQP